MERYINLKSLSVDELAGVVNLYPWFGLARKELCERVSRLGGSSWGVAQYADAAMYIPSRTMIADILRSAGKEDCSDADANELLKKYISENQNNTKGESGQTKPEDKPRQVYVVGGDYFSQAQYDSIERSDTVPDFRGLSDAEKENMRKDDGKSGEMDFCTETLAQIYAEQGYYERAKEIYSQLILAYPEKNVYFAALIEKLNKEIKNIR